MDALFKQARTPASDQAVWAFGAPLGDRLRVCAKPNALRAFIVALRPLRFNHCTGNTSNAQ
jgi:hypothetical protein